MGVLPPVLALSTITYFLVVPSVEIKVISSSSSQVTLASPSVTVNVVVAAAPRTPIAMVLVPAAGEVS